MKRYLIGYVFGIITVLGLLVYFHGKHPEWFIKKVTETKTEYKVIEGKDAKYCGDITITGTFTDNRLEVKAEDDCKVGTATFTIGHNTTYRHIFSVQLANTFAYRAGKNYGVDLNYTYLFSERLGLTFGVLFSTYSISPHAGFSILF